MPGKAREGFTLLCSVVSQDLLRILEDGSAAWGGRADTAAVPGADVQHHCPLHPPKYLPPSVTVPESRQVKSPLWEYERLAKTSLLCSTIRAS